MTRRLATYLLCLALGAGVVSAAELAGVSLPDEITVEGERLTLNGIGLREASFLKVDVYVAGIYLQETSNDPRTILESDQIKRIRMDFVYKKVDRKKLVAAWVEGLEANAGDHMGELSGSLDRLNGWMETLVRGDSMTFTAIPGKGLEVTVKGESRGWIEDEAFARHFWSIWLGPKPPNEGLKRGLLGLD
jgi:hypothetical protein